MMIKRCRAWNNKLSGIDGFIAWLYTKEILTYKERQKKDSIFRQYWRYYNDGDFPQKLRSCGLSKYDSDERIESELEEMLEEFIIDILSKYMTLERRQEFYVYKRVDELNTLIGVLTEPDPHAFITYWSKKIFVKSKEYAALNDKLIPKYEEAYKVITEAAIADDVSDSYTLKFKRELLSLYNKWTTELEDLYCEVWFIMWRMSLILQDEIKFINDKAGRQHDLE